MTRFSFVAALIGLMASPGQACSQVSKAATERPQRLQVDSIYQSGRSRLLTPTQTVVRDTAAWRTWWERIVANLGDKPPLPAVDFGRDMVLLVSSGTHPWDGFRVSIDSVILRQGQLVAYVTDVGPGSGCIAGAAFTQPVMAVRILRHDENVRFLTHTLRQECES